MVSTCTNNAIRNKLMEKGITVSYGTVLALKPFFVTAATEKEIALCLCKLCLNTRMLFEPLMTQAKKDGDNEYKSITDFFFKFITLQ